MMGGNDIDKLGDHGAKVVGAVGGLVKCVEENDEQKLLQKIAVVSNDDVLNTCGRNLNFKIHHSLGK